MNRQSRTVVVSLLLLALCLALAAGCAGGPVPGMPAPTKGIGMMFNFPPLDDATPQGPPGFFLRSAGAIGPGGEPIAMPEAYDEVLYEGELAIVIGRRARDVSVEEAEEYILGYTCGMDGSPVVRDANGERDAARSLFGKSADGVAPIGPRLVEKLAPEGHAIILRINGKEVERAHTRDLVWPPAHIVSELSRRLTLHPGDVIYAGARRAIPQFHVGDVVEVEIVGIGSFASQIVE